MPINRAHLSEVTPLVPLGSISHLKILELKKKCCRAKSKVWNRKIYFGKELNYRFRKSKMTRKCFDFETKRGTLNHWFGAF